MVWLAGATLKLVLTVLVRPVALAVSCLLPTTSISRLVKAAVPFPADVPMSRLVVPCSDPVPEESVRLTGTLDARPETELLP